MRVCNGSAGNTNQKSYVWEMKTFLVFQTWIIVTPVEKIFFLTYLWIDKEDLASQNLL